MEKKFTLGKNERLKSRKQIELLFSKGKSFSLSPFRVFYLKDQVNESRVPLQFGVGVSGKNFSKAVERNKIKRLAREAYRLQKNELKIKLERINCSMIVFFVYTSKEKTGYKQVFASTTKIIDKLLRIADESPVTYT